KVLICGAYIFLQPVEGAGIVPWMVTLVVARELVITGLRSFMENRHATFGADWLGKIKMGLQCAALFAIFVNLEYRETFFPVVIVTTPSGAHMEPAVAAAAAGKHVVVEKPLEVTLERCDRIIDACTRHQVQLCTIFPSRFGDANQALKAAVTAGRFGRLTL